MYVVIDFLAIIYCLFAISGFGTSAMLSILAVAVSILILLCNRFKLYKKDYSYGPFKYAGIFLILVGIEIFISGNISIKYLLSIFSFFFPIILYLYYRSKKNNIRILNIVMIIWGAITIRACYLYSTGIIAARALAAHKQTDVAFSGGGYGFAVGSAILAVYLTEMLLWKKIKFNILNIVYVIMLCYVVVLTQSTTTILALFLGLIVAFILRIFNVSSLTRLDKRKFVGVVMVAIVCFCFLGLRENIGRFILEKAASGSGIVSQRFLEVGTMLVGGSSSLNSSSDMIGRFDLLLESLKTFLQYPFMGLVSQYGTNFYTLYALGVGSHGEFFDTFAKYGLTAGIPYIAIFLTAFANERKNQFTSIGFGYLITFCVLFVFNPCLYEQVNVCVFYVIPLMTVLFNSNIEEESIKC